MIFRKTRERIMLLEYENEILFKRIEEIEKALPKGVRPIPPMPRIVGENGVDYSYETLKMKYRSFTPKFDY